MIIAALLHDIVEDTKFTYEQTKQMFGQDIMILVKGVTRERDTKETEEEHFVNKKKKFTETLKKSKNIRLIKCADWLFNLSNWSNIPKDNPWAKRFPRFLVEVQELYLPLAKVTDERIHRMMLKRQKEFEKYIG